MAQYAMTHPPLVLYAAPGAGLGHLVRAAAISMALSDQGIETRILTHSIFAQGLARLTGLDIIFIPANRWITDAPRVAVDLRPDLLVLDTFSLGIRGEWSELPYPDARMALVARRLKLDPYLAAVNSDWTPIAPALERVLVAEPLNPDYQSRLDQDAREMQSLDGRICFPAEKIDVPIPRGLQDMMDNGPVALVVHSGPAHEVQLLLDRAREDTDGHGSGRIALITPRLMEELGLPWFEYFPAAKLYSQATAIITGAGYNSLAETEFYHDKRSLIPFDRRYDDQPGRFKSPPMASADGTAQATRIICDWL
jgi:UDP:flavonoid glycosyltransferase YjiC (YdhE family)